MDSEQEFVCAYIGRIVAGTGLSATEIARKASLSPSTLTRIYPNPQVKHTLSARTLARVDRAFPGYQPPPPISASEEMPSRQAGPISALAEERQGYRAVLDSLGDVPMYASSLARTEHAAEVDGVEIGLEQIECKLDRPAFYVKRPTALARHDQLYALYVAGSVMEPRRRSGEPVFVDKSRPPSPGDDVIVILEDDGERPGSSMLLLRSLVRQTSGMIELEQYNPALRFSLPLATIAAVHRVVPWTELIDTGPSSH